MIPGVNPRQLKQMMRQMGMSQDDIDATEVVIKTKDKQYVFTNPSVQKVDMQNQTSFQISGDFVIQDLDIKIEISKEDIELVCKQTEVSFNEAKEALVSTKGDIAQAIVNINK